jgi:hypothetical protein
VLAQLGAQQHANGAHDDPFTSGSLAGLLSD